MLPILLIDSYDSFTFNLVQMLRVQGARVEVVRNDALPLGALDSFAGLLISPGPGRPAAAGATLACIEAWSPRRPLLGICLGHQALGVALGARLTQATALMHGKTSQVRHEGRDPLGDLPSPFTAMRYHSLVLDPASLPPDLEPIAWADDGALMGVAHRDRPWWGVQFHPESILTDGGQALVGRFLEICEKGGQFLIGTEA